jgi:hypothetical protein
MPTPTRPIKQKILQFEGHRYVIVENDPEVPQGFTRFVKDKDVSAPDAPEREGMCNSLDVKDSGEGWFFLPKRVAKPIAGDADRKIAPHPLKDTIRLHPAYAQGRDDLAIKAIESFMAAQKTAK